MADWGTARSSVKRQASLDLVNALAALNLPAMENALSRGGDPNVVLIDSPCPSTPLALAWWLLRHDHAGRERQTLPSQPLSGEAEIVSAAIDRLLTAGGRVDPEMLQSSDLPTWESTNHPIFERLESSVMDQLAQGALNPAVVVPTQREWFERVLGHVPSVVPKSSYHGPYTWAHRAVWRERDDALTAWFAARGIVSSTTGEALCATVWRRCFAVALPEAPEDTPSDERLSECLHQTRTTLAIVQPWLAHENDTVYRHEIIQTLSALTWADQTRQVPSSAALEACWDWLHVVLSERQLDHFQLAEHEIAIKGSHYEQMALHLHHLEEDLLDQSAPILPLQDRPRVRL